MADREAAAESGFFARLIGYASSLAAYLRARLALAGLEAKEAVVHYLIIFALAAAAVTAVLFGYFFLIMAIVFGLAALIGGAYTWIWLTFVVALVHFGGAAAALWMAKGRFTQPMFGATLNEFRKDQEWLSNPPEKLS